MLWEELKKTQERMAELIAENKRQKAEIDMFARVVNVLTVENDQLKRKLGDQQAPVVRLHPAPE
ncbi:hypothetical protein [Streptomyces sp. NBC_01235]|uniref:hypothetical protein n=1 Tax=Streptomyces sp. NBC_01235 TaxID=2903788 RepID=UPI002E121F93|nr:hypothetical protein OG289_48805 [Streptomyces sp. NBC_01235]